MKGGLVVLLAVLVATSDGWPADQEPECFSKFDYDVKMLGKMLAIENSFEKESKRIDNQVTVSGEKLSQFQTAIDTSKQAMEARMEEMERISKQQIQDMDEKTRDVEGRVVAIDQDMKTRFQDFIDQKTQQMEDTLAAVDQDVNNRSQAMDQKTRDVEEKFTAIDQDVKTRFQDFMDQKTREAEERLAAIDQDTKTRFQAMDQTTRDVEGRVVAIDQDVKTRFQEFMDQKTREVEGKFVAIDQDAKNRSEAMDQKTRAVDEKLAALDQDVKTRFQDFMDQKTREVEERLAAIDQDAKTRAQALAERNKETLTELETLKASMVEVIKKANQTSVAFSAHGIRNKNVTVGQKLLFSILPLNMGDGFDPSSGIFTAPVNGTYIFMAQLYVQKQYNFGVKVVARRNSIGRSFGKGTKGTDSSTGGWSLTVVSVARLTEGDQVWTECYVKSPSSGKGLYSDYGETAFKGVLVYT